MLTSVVLMVAVCGAFSAAQSREELCEAPRVVGPCRGAMPRWHFDSTQGKCVQFTYGGCQGNANNHKSMEECEQTCLMRVKRTVYTGPCDAVIQSTSRKVRMGRFVPQCMDSGFYKLVQCHGSTGYCWCVNAFNGEKQTGTDVAPAEYRRPECSACHKKLAKTLATGVRPGTFVHSCTKEGTYEKMQCHGSTGHCWCVDEVSGVEVEGTRQRGHPDCY